MNWVSSDLIIKIEQHAREVVELMSESLMETCEDEVTERIAQVFPQLLNPSS